MMHEVSHSTFASGTPSPLLSVLGGTRVTDRPQSTIRSRGRPGLEVAYCD